MITVHVVERGSVSKEGLATLVTKEAFFSLQA